MRVVPQREPHFAACRIAYDRLTPVPLMDIDVAAPINPREPSARPLQIKTRGIWDTGATRTVITESAARSLKLVPSGRANMSHARGTEEVNSYIVSLRLPNNVSVDGLQVLECKDLAAGAGVLVGMDVITRGDLAITNVGGKTVLSFRMPSIETIDYVEEARRRRFAGVKANDPCPCGKKKASGIAYKYKQCCGRNKQR